MRARGICIFFATTATLVLSIDIIPTESPTCVDESPFCMNMAIDGECYSEDTSTRSNMHESCKATCGTCTSSIPSCDNGTETYNNDTNTTCCYVNDTNGNSEFGHSYTEYTSGDVTYRNFSNNSGGCLVIPLVFWWPFVFGPIMWYWLLVVGIAGLAFGLFMAWIMFGQREEELDKLLETIGQDSGRVFKKASKMSELDILTITEHYKMMAAIGTFKTKGYEEEDDKVTPEGPPDTPYTVLVAIFKNSNINHETNVDKADFNMAISMLGVSPTILDISNVFERLDDGSRIVTVDQLFERIKDNIEPPEGDTMEDIIAVLRAAVIMTFVRERRASLSILKKFMDAHQTAGGYVSPDNEGYEVQSPRTPDGLIRADSVYNVVVKPEQKLLRSHDFNALLISMGVPFSENAIIERVMKLEAAQPEGIDGIEFKYMLEKDLKENPDALKSDVLVKVLDHLIARHGGEEAAKAALKTHHDREAMFAAGAGTAYNKQWSVDRGMSDEELAGDKKDWEIMLQDLSKPPKGTPQE